MVLRRPISLIVSKKQKQILIIHLIYLPCHVKTHFSAYLRPKNGPKRQQCFCYMISHNFALRTAQFLFSSFEPVKYRMLCKRCLWCFIIESFLLSHLPDANRSQKQLKKAIDVLLLLKSKEFFVGLACCSYFVVLIVPAF